MPAMPDNYRRTAKLVGLAAALLAGGGAAVEGYVPDAKQLEQLGIVGAAGIVLYLHYFIRPPLLACARWVESRWSQIDEAAPTDTITAEPARPVVLAAVPSPRPKP